MFSHVFHLHRSLLVCRIVAPVDRVPGSQWALERAKGNVLQYYLLVGVMEQMADFIAVLEACLPRIFHGAIDILNTGNGARLVGRKVARSVAPSPSPPWHLFSFWLRCECHVIRLHRPKLSGNSRHVWHSGTLSAFLRPVLVP